MKWIFFFSAFALLTGGKPAQQDTYQIHGSYSAAKVGSCWFPGNECRRYVHIKGGARWTTVALMHGIEIPRGAEAGIMTGDFSASEFTHFGRNEISGADISDGKGILFPDQKAVWLEEYQGFLVIFYRT